MRAIQRWLDRFCGRHPGFGIPNLMLIIAIGNVLVYVLDQFSGAGASLAGLLAFSQLAEKPQINWLHTFFDQLTRRLQYKVWYFGRYHRDLHLSQKARAVFCDVIPLE